MPLPLIADIILSGLLGSPHFLAALVCGALCAVFADQSNLGIASPYAGLGGFAAYSLIVAFCRTIWRYRKRVGRQ